MKQLPRMLLRGQSGPKVTFRKSREYGYLLCVKYFGRDEELIGTVRRAGGPYNHLWFAFKWEEDKSKIFEGKPHQYIKGARSRRSAARALMIVLGLA